jgi:hypothetical protein
LHEYKNTLRRIRPFLFLLLAFFAGGLVSGICIHRQGPRLAGELDSRYAAELLRATEAVGRLTAELERERQLNRELLDHNRRAREIAGGLTGTAERNVRNLQEAVGLIGEIRKKLKVLEDFYADSGPDGGGD